MSEPLRIYIIAGEASGDLLGGRLMASLKHLSPQPISFFGIGGERMIEQGLTSLFPMQELSLMGFVEVLPHIQKLKRRIHQTVFDITQQHPDILITIDSPGFTFRVVRELAHENITGLKKIHYVAPSVWAYKPQRAAKTARLFDALMTLMSFEPPYFTAHDLPTTWVGHQVAWEWRDKGDGDAFRNRHNISQNATVVGMMPGSRRNEIKRHMKMFKRAVKHLHQQHPDLHIIIPTRSDLHAMVARMTKKWPVPVTLIQGDTEKKDAFAAMNLAIAKSGTVSLECALAGVPNITVYRANKLSMWIVRRMAVSTFVNLVNIINQREVVPELIQENFTPAKLAQTAHHLLSDDAARTTQIEAFKMLADQLGASHDASPSDRAAKVVLGIV